MAGNFPCRSQVMKSVQSMVAGPRSASGIVVQGCDTGLPGYGRLVMGPVEVGCCFCGVAVGQPLAALLRWLTRSLTVV